MSASHWNRRVLGWILAATMAALALAACGLMVTPVDPTSRLPPLRPSPVRRFERVVIIVLENQDEDDAIRNPYLLDLARRGAYLANFRGLFHNSYPNYLAMVSGTIFSFAEIRGDDSDRQVDWPPDHRSIADELEAKGLGWKAYAEDYPGRSGGRHPSWESGRMSTAGSTCPC